MSKAGSLTFGIVICHDGFRCPETVRAAARAGAQVVFHPHFAEPTPGSFRPERFCDSENTFHEKALPCRAAENTVWSSRHWSCALCLGAMSDVSSYARGGRMLPRGRMRRSGSARS